MSDQSAARGPVHFEWPGNQRRHHNLPRRHRPRCVHNLYTSRPYARPAKARHAPLRGEQSLCAHPQYAHLLGHPVPVQHKCERPQLVRVRPPRRTVLGPAPPALLGRAPPALLGRARLSLAEGRSPHTPRDHPVRLQMGRGSVRRAHVSNMRPGHLGRDNCRRGSQVHCSVLLTHNTRSLGILRASASIRRLEVPVSAYL